MHQRFFENDAGAIFEPLQMIGNQPCALKPARTPDATVALRLPCNRRRAPWLELYIEMRPHRGLRFVSYVNSERESLRWTFATSAY
jgi:hypothetical protein